MPDWFRRVRAARFIGADPLSLSDGDIRFIEALMRTTLGVTQRNEGDPPTFANYA